jgi:hypothetical protein
MYESTGVERFTPLLPSITSIVRGGGGDPATTARVVTSAVHGLTTGEQVIISGTNQPEYLGIKTVTVINTTTFTFTTSALAVTPATGTIVIKRYFGGLFNPRNLIGLGKALQPNDKVLALRLPGGHRLEFGEEFGDAVLKAIHGELDLQSDSTNDITRVRAGTQTISQFSNTRITASQPMRLPLYTVATLPSASNSGAGAEVYVTDAAGGSTSAVSDGSVWRRHDRTVVS